MGLDIVDLILEVEETFSIKLPEDQLSCVTTVGDLHKLILEQTDLGKRAEVCLSSTVFFTIRNAATALGATGRLRPRDSTIQLLPERNRRNFWRELERHAQLRFPKLCRPNWLSNLLLIVPICASITPALSCYTYTDSIVWAFASYLASLCLIGLTLHLLTLPLAVWPGKSFQTIRGLSESILRLNFEKLSAMKNGSNAGDVWIVLRSVIAEQLGVATDQVIPAARFVQDLGCD